MRRLFPREAVAATAGGWLWPTTSCCAVPSSSSSIVPSTTTSSRLFSGLYCGSNDNAPRSSEATPATAEESRRSNRFRRAWPGRSKDTATHSKRGNKYKRQQQQQQHTATSMDFYTDTQVPRSLDIGAQEAMMDVERFFPRAMAHLKAHPSTPDVAQDKDARRWHDATHTVNVDGFESREKVAAAEDRLARADGASAARVHSFFDQGSLDIRGGLPDACKARAGGGGGGGASPPSTPPPSSAQERLSPDILQLTGGKPRLHGAALAAQSNAAPADLTLEASDGNYMGKQTNHEGGGEFGDAPVQLTDMLRERLMELKGQRLQEERNDTFMPRRLPFKSDADIAREMAQADRQALLRLATGAQEQQRRQQSGGDSTELLLRRQSASPVVNRKTRVRTLADAAFDDAAEAEQAAWDDGEGKGKEEGNAAPAPVPAILRDGVSQSQRQQAASVLRHALATNGAAVDAEDDLLLSSLDGGLSFRTGAKDAECVKDGVYLLRALPRASLCSRREAATMIASGQVRVNNVVERNPFRLVKAQDDVHVAGHKSRLRFAPPRLWMYHKPANVVVSRFDPAGRAIISKHARILGIDHLIPIGSLPMRAHGLLLMTNDGELSRFLENPRANTQQTYLLRVRPAVDAVLAHKLNTEGVNINGRQYKGAMELLVNPAAKSRYSLKVKVRGEHMSVSQLMQHLGRKIERGGRVSYGPFSLSTLPVGSVREVSVPPFYAQHLGAVWQSFVERDWPYFRRQRVSRLRRLSRYRELTPRELEELDNYTYEEVQGALRLDAQELATAADAHEGMVQQHQRPSFTLGQAIPHDFGTAASSVFGRQEEGEKGHWGDGQDNDDEGSSSSSHTADDIVVEDITRLV